MENNDIFDSLVRERLQEAEVRAPRGTWASISFVLDTMRRGSIYGEALRACVLP